MNQSKEYKQMARRLEYPHMSAFQVNTIKALRNGQDAFVIAAPGQGKSGIFHGAALLDERKLVLVVEPTISLIMDQVKRLRSLKEKPVAVDYMTHHNLNEHSVILDRVIRGGVTLLFVTPERLQNKTFQQAIAQNEPWLVVVDEAHLVLHWGRTFRRDYDKIGRLVHIKCESRVENERNKGSGNAAKDVKKKARKRADQRSRLDIGQAVEPVEKTLNRLTNGADEGRKSVAGNQDIAFVLFPWGK